MRSGTRTIKDRHSWLTYSIIKNGMMCLPCFLFIPDHQNQSNSGKGPPSNEWAELGLSDWKAATGKDGKIKKHETSEIHMRSCEQMKMLLLPKDKSVREAFDSGYALAQERK